MSEEIIPDVLNTSDVPETVETVGIDEINETAEPAVNWSEKNLAELVKAIEGRD